MTQVDKLRIYFILPSDNIREDELSTNIKLAHQAVSKYGAYVEWMKPTDCVDHLPQDKDVFVFDKFEGIAFETLKRDSSKYVVLGAQCLLTCITNGRSIPSNPHPVFTEGMRNLWITSSGFDQATKKEIQEKVQYMSGYYDNSLRGVITHLVAHNNITNKAINAYKSKIKIMKLSWVEDVWQQSMVNNVNGSDEIFNKHLSPLFHNLNITTSGIHKREKNELKEKIESYGGRFMGTLEGNITNIVILTKPEGEKFKFAKAWNITCVKPQWVYDCIDAKVILPFKEYIIDSNTKAATKPKSSTPNKENFTANISANFTANLSAINSLTNELAKHNTHVDETGAVLSMMKNDFQTPRTQDASKAMSKAENTKISHTNIINNILLKNLKDAGQCLDGLNIFLYGFHSDDTEKLKKVLNKVGAVRFNEMSESVTHVISGKKDDPNLPNLAKNGAYVLSIDWLVESMKLKSKAMENQFLLVSNTSNAGEPPSPMSKQGAQLLSQTESRGIQKPAFSLEGKEEEEEEKLSQLGDLLSRYNASQPGDPLDKLELPPPIPTSSSPQPSTSKMDCTSDSFFMGLTFFLSNDLAEEEIKYLEDLIVERKGQIIRKRDLGLPDFAVVPVIGATLTDVTAKEVVNIFFIDDCCVEKCLLSPRYYHQPVACVKNATPLKDCVVSVSNYVQGEREFMEMLIKALGGVAQSLLARKPKQGALKSTHLVCAEPHGQKYDGALRWGLPVVHHYWLLKCAALGIRVSEKPYLVGDSKMPVDSKGEMTLHSKSITSSRLNDVTKAPSTQTDNPVQSSSSHAPSEAKALGSKSTPVHSALARVKATETPKNSSSPDPNRTVTPTSPYGAFYGKGNPTPTTRKRIWKWMNQGAEFPLDPPPKPVEPEETTPISKLISDYLKMVSRKPEELPPDSPVGVPLKRLNLESNCDKNDTSVGCALEKMKHIEQNFAKNGFKSPPVKNSKESDGCQVVVMAESQPATEVGWEDLAEKEVALENLEKAAKVAVKVFMFSCIDEQLQEVKELVEDCGGKVSPLSYFDSSATHLIAGNLTRAEKLMGSVASGLWVLHPSYVEALRKAKNVNDVPEEDYEWGSPKQKFRLNLLSSTAKDLAICSYTWRVSIQNGGPRPFKDMKILLHLSEAKFDSFKRLIEAGGGKVSKGLPPDYHDCDANLCVYEAVHSEPINFASLAKQKIRCVALVYISDVLVKKENAIERNLVPDFLEFWKRN